MKPIIQSFYHQPTFTWSHILYCDETKQAAVIDPVMDFNLADGEISDDFISNIIEFIQFHSLELAYILETHAHADHLSASQLLKNQFASAKLGIGEGISKTQKIFKEVFNLGSGFATDGSQFDFLLSDNDYLKLGNLGIRVFHVPGHTEDSVCYHVGENVFIGDTMFAPEFGTARCDFPEGDSGKLYDSIQKLFSLGEENRLYLCHDYPEGGRSPQAFFYSKDQQLNNIHLNNSKTKKQFIQLRNERDKVLATPALILPSIQVNITAGRLPSKEPNDVSYLKIPLSQNQSKYKL